MQVVGQSGVFVLNTTNGNMSFCGLNATFLNGHSEQEASSCIQVTKLSSLSGGQFQMNTISGANQVFVTNLSTGSIVACTVEMVKSGYLNLNLTYYPTCNNLSVQ